MATTTQKMFRRLLKSLGPQSWWPGESPLEVMVGAILVQNTAWKNVERAIANLREAALLDPHQLLEIGNDELEQLIRPAGYFRIKARRLRSLLEFFVDQYGASIEALQAADMQVLRQQLLEVHGIGPETADSILLYALDKPALVVDTYTHRVFSRHGWLDYDTDYHQLQAHVASELPVDAPLYNELHALVVNIGHHYCRKTPRCEECPLKDMLPKSGIVMPE